MENQSEILIRLIQDEIHQKYGNPYQAFRKMEVYYQTRGEKSVSLDTVTRVYNYTGSDGYTPRLSSLQKMAAALGILASTREEEMRYSRSRALRNIEGIMKRYRSTDSIRMLESMAVYFYEVEQVLAGHQTGAGAAPSAMPETPLPGYGYAGMYDGAVAERTDGQLYGEEGDISGS